MKTQIFTVYDIKAEVYLVPWYSTNDKQAMRIFGDAVNNAETMFNKHPFDYALMHIGEFDDETGKIDMFENNKHLGIANEYLVKQENTQNVK